MPDVMFKALAVKKTYQSYAQKLSVVWPLSGHRCLSDDDVIRDIANLHTRWRKRLTSLKIHGWPDLQERGKLQFARNCPPVGIVCGSNTTCRCCRLVNICPWCYMRNVEKLYHKLAKLLPERGAFKTQGIQLLEVTSKMTMSKRDAGKFLSGHVAEWQKVPQRLVRRLHSLGAYRNILIDPKAVDKHRSGWRFQYRILAVMPTDWQIPEWLVNNNRKLRVTYVQSKKQLINVVGRTCRYPTGLLQGTPRMAMIALNARRGKRCSEYTGCLRSGGEEEDDDDNGNRKKTSN